MTYDDKNMLPMKRILFLMCWQQTFGKYFVLWIHCDISFLTRTKKHHGFSVRSHVIMQVPHNHSIFP